VYLVFRNEGAKGSQPLVSLSSVTFRN